MTDHIERINDKRNEVSGGYELDVVGTLIAEPEKNVSEFSSGKLCTEQLIADRIVLAEDTVQAATGKKDRTCAVFVGNAGLLPFVQVSLSRD